MGVTDTGTAFKSCRTILACCALWQYHKPGKSHQEDYGYPEWGDRPNMQYPNGMQLGTRDGNVGWNAVVMWTNIKDKDETKKDKQALIIFLCFSASPSLSAFATSVTTLPPHPSCSWMSRTPRRSMGSLSWRTTSAVTTRSNCSGYQRHPILTTVYHSNPHQPTPSSLGGNHAQHGRDLRIRR